MSTQALTPAQQLAEMLQSPDDLAKIPAIRKKLEKEKASIDTRLKTGVKEQLDATREGLRKLLNTRKNVQVIKDEMARIDELGRNPENDIPNFDQISRLSMVHRNFQRTSEMVNSFLELSYKVEVLEEMLISEQENIAGSSRYLLAIHYQLTQLEAFRSQTTHQAKSASAESQEKLKRLFEPLNNLTEAFDDHILALARDILPIIRAGHPETIVKLVKIAEIEGREDEKAIAIRLVKKAAKLDAASKFKSMQANARVIKHYRSKITKCISDSIKAAFEAALERNGHSPIAFLDNMNWLYQDIIRIQQDVIQCFPQSWDIYAFYMKEYHKALDVTLKNILASEPEASVLLTVYAWLKEYKRNMKELDVPVEFNEPPLLAGKDQDLIEDYVQLIIKKLDEWTGNLMETEVTQFTSRTEPPDVDSDGLYGMQGTVILMELVNQQVDLAMESKQGAVLARVVTETNRVLRSTQSRWLKVIEAEYKKQADKPEEAVGGLVEYCIALANDQVKMADFAEALSARLEPLVSEKYSSSISERLNDAIDGYLDVAKRCTQTLIDIVFLDLKPATKQLFQAGWYDGVMSQIVETMRDYMADYQSFLNTSILELLVEDLLDAFLVCYLTALANAPKLKMPAATDRIKEDVSLAFSFFSTLKPAKELESYFEVLEMVLALLEASKSLAFLSFWSFAKVHGPNIAFVEGLMRARDDLDRSSANEVMESIKRKVKEEKLTDPSEPTIMKKIAVQGMLSRFLRT